MSQKSKILELLKNYDRVTCEELAVRGLYHHGSQRIGELKKEGYRIEFTQREDWKDSSYTLVSEPLAPIEVKFDGDQRVFA